jgi:hypothetical protein
MPRGESINPKTLVGTHPKDRQEGEVCDEKAPKCKGIMSTMRAEPAHIFWEEEKFWVVETVDIDFFNLLLENGHVEMQTILDLSAANGNVNCYLNTDAA